MSETGPAPPERIKLERHFEASAAIDSINADIRRSYGIPPAQMGVRPARSAQLSHLQSQMWGEARYMHHLGSPVRSGPERVDLHTPGILEPVGSATVKRLATSGEIAAVKPHQCKTVPVRLKTLDREHVADLCPVCDAVTYMPWCYPVIPVAPAYSSQPPSARISRTTRMMTTIVMIFTAISQIWVDMWNGLKAVLR